MTPEPTFLFENEIMIIEDDQDIRELMQEFLKDEGYTVAAFPNGAQALAKLQSGYQPRIILLDWRMPVMSGPQFLAELKKLPAKDTPVYIFSAESDVRRLDDFGCSGYLQKPVNFTALLAMLEKAMSGPSRPLSSDSPA
jgi:CheY-like chemotaxis protein